MRIVSSCNFLARREIICLSLQRKKRAMMTLITVTCMMTVIISCQVRRDWMAMVDFTLQKRFQKWRHFEKCIVLETRFQSRRVEIKPVQNAQ